MFSFGYSFFLSGPIIGYTSLSYFYIFSIVFYPESVFLGIEAPTTLQMPYTKAPLLRANCMAATVPSGHTSFVTPYTSQRRSRMPQKEAG